MDTNRLARALWLDVRRVGACYVVTGGRCPHRVTIAADRSLCCDCPDFSYRGGTSCKHTIAVKLHQGDGPTLRALRALVPIPVRAARAPVLAGAA